MTGNKTNGARGARRTKSTILPRRDRATRKRPTHLLLELGGDLLGLGWGLHDGEHGSRCDHGGVAGEGSARLLGFREGRGRREGRKASRVRACQPRARSPSSTAVGRERGGGAPTWVFPCFALEALVTTTLRVCLLQDTLAAAGLVMPTVAMVLVIVSRCGGSVRGRWVWVA